MQTRSRNQDIGVEHNRRANDFHNRVNSWSKAQRTEAPQRRFRSVHDAAAWIQVNMPDFDLEATSPRPSPWALSVPLDAELH